MDRVICLAFKNHCFGRLSNNNKLIRIKKVKDDRIKALVFCTAYNSSLY